MNRAPAGLSAIFTKPGQPKAHKGAGGRADSAPEGSRAINKNILCEIYRTAFYLARID